MEQFEEYNPNQLNSNQIEEISFHDGNPKQTAKGKTSDDVVGHLGNLGIETQDSKNSLFHIRFTSSEKVGESLTNTFVKYTIEVKTKASTYQNQEFTVVRRYSDFAWLREQLQEHYPGYLIPPLPEKQLFNRFNPEFMEFRKKELEKFLQRVTSHHVLCTSPQLQQFFEFPTDGQAPLKSTIKKDQQQSATGANSGILSFFGNSIENISSGFSDKSDPDQWFDAKKNYVNGLENQLTALEKVVNNLLKKRKEYGQAIKEFGLCTSLVASAEADHDSLTSGAFDRLSDMAAVLASLESQRADEEALYFEEPIKDYIRMLGAVKEMLQVRTDKLTHFQSLSKQLEQKKDKQEKKANPKVEKEIEELQKKVSDAEDEFRKISDIAKAEIQRFESTKTRDFHNLLLKLNQIQLTSELQIVDQWKNALDNLQQN
mmetsp:Transcript_22651/g.31533  ORF Transcript_22651/g.31533 Transcript_22651/m.31533 type:complete len:429 (+) Transcript_22651:73-1359(+)|eukprot:CAMPEP_0168551242 /NCGR_PEP_ID=MMETSP0413-20121227/6064_1 /TAXON_ID=136452 /ORGANISM="Filamoeba nolandi, Strain NC-AS-23-1" /LENGTH=428 /DNA_ID=CAMNT_0008581747 /DNA_START=27 /DNA_END=1313 /DNA_ORIENTATION=-